MTKFAPESFTEEELMTNADVRKATGRYLLLKDGPEQQALGLKIVEAQERLNRAAQYERSQHFEPLYRGGVEKLEGKFIDLPGMAYSPDPKEDVAAGVNQNYVAAEYGLDPDQVGNLWQWYRGEFSREKFGFEAPSDKVLFLLNAKWESNLRERRETEEKKLGEAVLNGTVAGGESGWKQGAKAFLGGAADASLATVQGVMTQMEGFAKKQAETAGITDQVKFSQLNQERESLESTLRDMNFQETSLPGGAKPSPYKAQVQARLKEIAKELAPMIEEGKRNASSSTWSFVADGYGEAKDWWGERRKNYAEFYQVSPEFQESFVGKVTYGAGQMLPQIVAAELPGIGMAALQSQAFQSAYDDAKTSAERNGEAFDPEKAYAYAYVASLSGMLLERAGIDSTLGKWMKVGGEKTLKNVLKRAAGGFFGEGSTEAAQGVVNDALARGMGIDAHRNPFDLERRIEEFGVGGVLGSIVAQTHVGGPESWPRKNPARLADPATPEFEPERTMKFPHKIGQGTSAARASEFAGLENQGHFEKDGNAENEENQPAERTESEGHLPTTAEFVALSRIGAELIEDRNVKYLAVKLLPDGRIELRYNPKTMLEQENSFGGRPGLVSRIAMNEEIEHVALDAVIRDAWVAAGKPGSASAYAIRVHSDIFADMRRTIESAPLREQAALRQALRDSYKIYHSKKGDPPNERLEIETIFDDIEAMGTYKFVGEFLRQVGQLKRKGVITEEIQLSLLRKIKIWLEAAIKHLKKTLPGAERGEFGPVVQQALKDIEEKIREASPPDFSVNGDE